MNNNKFHKEDYTIHSLQMHRQVDEDNNGAVIIDAMSTAVTKMLGKVSMSLFFF